MSARMNLLGEKFGRLTVTGAAGSTTDGKSLWHCLCVCGSKTTVIGCDLKQGKTKSCGCLNKERPWNYKGGKRKNSKGYMLLLMHDHPDANCKGYIFEHRLKAEKALGKLLPSASVVHHHNPTQLVLCEDQAYHLFLHRRSRAILGEDWNFRL